MTEKGFKEACVNLAAFMYSSWKRYGYKTKDEFWQAVPGKTKKQIMDFVSLYKEPIIRKND